ncbi:LysM peptidoglycan-binding domain-containing protein [Vagococcus sp. BWB3-3]|uniref:LysM peptidoglycan-binding domain-containing protein n=1 Tax=Vagococcus allomyrinae TaxID=2794353 RepID=A0A940SQU4_9ENTE|nr:GH25 family lysozyme [Vagococcus allomyrinae]MBP1040092.1 LysM peptidoglycan-binding domain-containing protein [Vagococcus allomyrinae]
MTRPRPVILDISEHQLPSQLNYPQLAQAIDWVIIRVQYGSLYQDKHFQTHLTSFKNLNVPVNVYAWVRGINGADMEKEAEDFYRRAVGFQPSFWWLDIEEGSMGNMVKGCELFRRRLKELGAKKVGAYIANHRYREFGFTSESVQAYDALWLPTYGQNDGSYRGVTPTATANYDLHQYTSNGRLPGYPGPLDLSRLVRKTSAFFTETESLSSSGYQIGDQVTINGIFVSSTSTVQLRPLRTQGTITRVVKNAANPYLLDDGMGWVNGRVIVKKELRQYQVSQGETLSGIAQKLGVSWQEMARLNQLANPHLIYPGQLLRY